MQCWLEERWLVDVGHSVKIPIYRWLMTDCRFPKKLESPDMLCELSLPVAKTTDSELKSFIRVSVKVSGLEGPAFW